MLKIITYFVLSLYILSTCWCELNGIIKVGEYSSSTSLETIKPFGMKMCVKKCFNRKDCNSFTFDRSALQCVLYAEDILDSDVTTSANKKMFYSSVSSWSGFTGACSTSPCTASEVCSETASSGICSATIKPCLDQAPSPARHSSIIASSVTYIAYTCDTGFVIRGSGSAVCQLNGTWSTPVYRCHRSYDGWILVSRFTKEIGTKTYTSYTDVGFDSENDPDVEDACFSVETSGCTHHYRSSLLDEWGDLDITEVKVGFFTSGVELNYIKFDPTATSYTSFFSVAKVLNSSWTDVIPGMSASYFSFEGISNGVVDRRFYAAAYHSGCPGDVGWMIVLDGTGNCGFDQHSAYPVFLYSSSSGSTILNTGLVESDVFAVLLKITNFS